MNELLEALRALPKAERRAAALLANPTFQEAVRLASQEDDEALFALVQQNLGLLHGLFAAVQVLA